MLRYALVATGVTLHAALHVMFNAEVPEAFMDEVFHFPLTASYCSGDWSAWHPKVTTPPGLYVLGAAFSELHGIGTASATRACGLSMLRGLNSVLAIATIYVLAALLRELHPSMTPLRALLGACALGALPTHFFFSFVWYTDVGSLFLVLVAYLMALRRCYWTSAAVSCAALTFRQTNGVWAAYILGDAALRALGQQHGAVDLSDWSVAGVARSVAAVVPGAVRTAKSRAALAKLLPLGIPIGALAAFVKWNGGRIALGDVANHTPVLHFAQLAYFIAFAAAFRAPLLLSALRELYRALHTARGCRTAAAALLLLAAAVQYGTFDHPFTLSDNRHYTFYVWRRVLGRGAGVRLALVPAYALALWLVRHALLVRPRARSAAEEEEEEIHMMQTQARKQRATTIPSPLIVLGLALCTAAVLIPARLIEPRYFTVPWMLLQLHAGFGSSRAHVLAPLYLFAFVNAATLYLFLCRSYTWPDGSTARFMW